MPEDSEKILEGNFLSDFLAEINDIANVSEFPPLPNSMARYTSFGNHLQYTTEQKTMQLFGKKLMEKLKAKHEQINFHETGLSLNDLTELSEKVAVECRKELPSLENIDKLEGEAEDVFLIVYQMQIGSHLPLTKLLHERWSDISKEICKLVKEKKEDSKSPSPSENYAFQYLASTYVHRHSSCDKRRCTDEFWEKNLLIDKSAFERCVEKEFKDSIQGTPGKFSHNERIREKKNEILCGVAKDNGFDIAILYKKQLGE